MFSPLNSKPIVKPNQTPETNGTNNKPEPTTLNLTTPEENRDINQKIISDRTIPECDNVGKKPAPEGVTRKPPKLKTKATRLKSKVFSLVSFWSLPPSLKQRVKYDGWDRETGVVGPFLSLGVA